MSGEDQRTVNEFKDELHEIVRSAAVDALDSGEESSVNGRITRLETVMSERNRVAESNGKWLAAVAAAVAIQIMFALVSAGTKYQLIDDIKSRVADLRTAFDAHVAADATYREFQSQKFQTLRSDLEKEIYYKNEK